MLHRVVVLGKKAGQGLKWLSLHVEAESAARAVELTREQAVQMGFLREHLIVVEGHEIQAIGHIARELGLAPTQVVVDITDGLIHQVWCDAGAVEVLFHDSGESSPDDRYELPVGEGGSEVMAWACIHEAQPHDDVPHIFSSFLEQIEERYSET